MSSTVYSWREVHKTVSSALLGELPVAGDRSLMAKAGSHTSVLTILPCEWKMFVGDAQSG